MIKKNESKTLGQMWAGKMSRFDEKYAVRLWTTRKWYAEAC